MSAERWVRFVSEKEANKFKQVLGSTVELGVEGEFGCWFSWRNPSVLKIEHTFYFLNTLFTAMLTCEICNNFKVRSIGADSVGWYKDSEMCGQDSKYKTWVDYFKAYSIRRDRMFNMFDEKEFSKFENTSNNLINTLLHPNRIHPTS